MSWQFEALRAVYPFTFAVSVTIIALLSRWVDRTHSYINDIESETHSNYKVIYPGDVYTTFVLASVTTIISVALCVTKISRVYGFRAGTIFIHAFLLVLWLADAIVILAKKNHSSMMDKDFATKKLPPDTLTNHDKLNEAGRIGTAVMSLAWIEFFILLMTIGIKLSVNMKRKEWKKNQSESKSFGSQGTYDKDAKELSMDIDAAEAGEIKREAIQERENLVENGTSLPPIENGNAKNTGAIEVKTLNDEIYAEAQYDFRGKKDADLSFKVGDKIRIIKKTNNVKDWWQGEANGKVGEFPGNYVKPL
ncbi:hypothetical protein G9A89_010593 [Geosiphon pyriformis]|nr:hypothetical protein G9A89_010593 [Geosiphon pyriformis]